jgi:glycine/sarcosine N-methyltransferase
MEFYHILAKYYDEPFPIKEPQKKFFREYLESNRLTSVLDVGCGTGSYVLNLSNSDIRAMGVDLSTDMVEIAASRARESGSSAEFAKANMLDLSTVSQDFDAVLCIGNTLAHLNGEVEIQQALKQFSLKGSHLILQVVNYDRILAKKVTELPEIRTENLSFVRKYSHLENGTIDFSMEIEVFGQGTVVGAVNRLFPVTRARLESALNYAGWKSASWYGSFAGEPWSENSPATIVTAKL